MEEARSELTFARFNAGAFQAFIDLADQVRRRLTAMAEDSSLYAHAKVHPELLPSLPKLMACAVQGFSDLADALRRRSKEMLSGESLERAVRDLDSDLAGLRQQCVTAPLSLDRMLPFWSFVFNLREVAQDLRQLARNVGELA